MFRKLVNNITGGFAAGLFALGVAALVVAPIVPASAQATRPTAPRSFSDQQTTYLRFPINFNSCVPVALTCSFRVGAVPYNSFLVRAYTQTFTTFTGATTATVSFGTSAGSANIMAAATILTAGNAVAQTIAAGGLGVTVTGNGIAQTGALGGFDIYATITYTVAVATAGAAVGIIEFIEANDGSCAPVPTGATAAGC
jgi:hypothetical protein